MYRIHPTILRELRRRQRLENVASRARRQWLVIAWGLAVTNVVAVALLRYLAGDM